MSSIQITLAQSSDQNDWDNYVEHHPLGSAYHRYAWKQALETAYQHRTFYFLAKTTHAENEPSSNKSPSHRIVGLLPTTIIKPPLASGTLCSLPFCDVGGCLADSDAIKQALLEHAIDFANANNLKKFEHRSFYPESIPETISAQPKVRMLLELPETSAALLAGFKSKLRSQINKAKKNGLTIRLGREPELINAFYDVFTDNMHKLGSPVHGRALFEQVIKYYGENAIISTVWKDNAITGAGIVLLNGKQASIPWASTKSEFNRLAPNMLLYWSLLEYVTDRGCNQFDFGRSTAGEGTYKFKKQWGAEPVMLDWQTFEIATGAAKAIQSEHKNAAENTQPVKLRAWVENAWRKMPLGLTVAIGPRIRKYISL